MPALPGSLTSAMPTVAGWLCVVAPIWTGGTDRGTEGHRITELGVGESLTQCEECRQSRGRSAACAAAGKTRPARWPVDAATESAADMIGARTDEDPGGVRALVAVCGALPRAVVAGAAYVAARPHWDDPRSAARLDI